MKLSHMIVMTLMLVFALPSMAAEPTSDHKLRDAAIVTVFAPLIAVSVVTGEILGHTVDSRFLVRIPTPACLSSDNKVRYIKQENANYSYASYATCS